MARVAFLGLGTMGQGMVENLLAAGHDVAVHNRTPERVRPAVAAGARAAVSPAEAVADAEYVLYCFSDDAAVEAVVLSEGGLAQQVPSSALVVDLSTVSPEVGERQHAAYGERGVRFLDAPVFGSRGEAAAGGLWVVVGGAAGDVAAAAPVLEPIAESIHHMGGPGSGNRMKLVGNMLVAAQLQSLGDALTLARRNDLDLSAVLDVLDRTDFRTPLYSGVGRKVLQDDYRPDFSLRLLLKDLGLVHDLAASAGVDLPALSVVEEAARAGVEEGLGEENASALVKVLARRAGVNLADPAT